MNRCNNLPGFLLWVALLAGLSAAGAPLPSAWQHEQPLDVTTNGLVKITLPVETLNTARPALEDLRLYDDAGNEIPYLIERPVPRPKIIQHAKSFRVDLNPDTTVILLETGLSEPLDAVTLETPALDFIKAVNVTSSDDGATWQPLALGQVIFRQLSGPSQLRIAIPAGAFKWLRLTVEDQRSQPIPFTGALVHAATGTPASGSWIPAVISERDESPGETRLALDLGAANLSIASLRLETVEPLFMREVSVAFPKVSEDSVSEQIIGQGAVYRVALEGHPVSERLTVPLEILLHSRELILLVKNGDSPPLPISSVYVERRSVNLIFFSRHPGAFHLLTGNPDCEPPRYDLAALGLNLQAVTVLPMAIPPPSNNPAYRAPEALPGLELTGTTLDVSEWMFRKPLKITNGGAQQIELDLDVLAHSQGELADLRVMRGSNQVPYIIQRTSISRPLTPLVTTTNDPKDPRLSRWIIKLPKSQLPITRLSCVVTTPLFNRTMSLYEEVADERGAKYRHDAAGGTWIQTPDRKSREFALALSGAIQSDTLYLETLNGDNPPIKLDQVTAYYPATRILFKAAPDGGLYLYYGNPRVAPPSYDLSLAAAQLLTADRRTSSLSDEEQLKKSSWRDNQTSGQGGVVFWGVLALVVVVLLVIISRLLPKPPTQATG
jgi:hypothetical protein